MTERYVQAIWYDAALRPNTLYTRRGSRVTVVSPGEWNLEAGPDFKHAVLELGPERRRVEGDVEIHLCPADWDLHGHGSDPKYRNVIANVTWGCGPVPKTLPTSAVSIWLGRFALNDPAFTTEDIDPAAYPYARLPLDERPCARWLEDRPERARELLEDAGRHRLQMKARRLVGRLCALSGRRTGDRRQVFYEEVMTALGYKNNSSSFRHVAERIPWREIPRETEVAQSAFLVAGSFESWDRSGTRPANHPENRLRRAAEAFTKTPLAEFINMKDFGEEACRKMLNAVRSCIGPGRAAAILANVIVPFALAEERIREPPSWLPPEDVSSPVRLTAFRLFGMKTSSRNAYAKNGLQIQGLLQIHRDYCLSVHPDCRNCALIRKEDMI